MERLVNMTAFKFYYVREDFGHVSSASYTDALYLSRNEFKTIVVTLYTCLLLFHLNCLQGLREGTESYWNIEQGDNCLQ